MSESDSVQQTWATVTDEPVALPSGEDVLLLGGTVRDDGPAEPRVEVRSVFGVIGPEVTGIELRLADGTTVTATVQAGLWAAWWPTTVSRPTSSGSSAPRRGNGSWSLMVALPMD